MSFARSAATGLDHSGHSDQAPARPAAPGSRAATDWAATPAPGDASTHSPSSSSGSDSLTERSAAPGQDRMDPAEAPRRPRTGMAGSG